MVNIIITPAIGGKPGKLTAVGHAGAGPKGTDMVCCAITALIAGLVANLEACWDVKVTTKGQPGDLELSWRKANRKGRGMERANHAAGYCYTALRALQEDCPPNLRVEWRRVEIE